jgi:metal-responsive CopG/Arc/MetJ family transcriptional regulator
MAKERFSISMEEELLKKLDKMIKMRRLGANRSQAIEYCVKQVLELEQHETRYVEFLIDFLKIVEKHPEVGEKLRAFLREEKVGR